MNLMKSAIEDNINVKMGTLDKKMDTLEDNINIKMGTLDKKMEEMMMNQKRQAEEQKVLTCGLIEMIKQIKRDDLSDSQIDSLR